MTARKLFASSEGILFSLFLLLPNLVAAQDDTCTPGLEDQCGQCGWWGDSSGSAKQYNCSLPGLEEFSGGEYEGIQANYLSYNTEVAYPFFPERAKEFERCTGGRVVFSEAQNAFQDPIEDLGTLDNRGSEVYDGYLMSYSFFPEASALKLAEPLNERIRKDNARLKWEDMLPAIKKMSEYKHVGGENSLEFLMYDGDFFVPIIRMDLLEKHDLAIPNTWEEVVEYAKFFNGTDLNDDGEEDYGFCHFPRVGAGHWDWWWSELVYSTWATTDQTKGLQEGFFFDENTLDPRINGEGFRYSAQIWKDLWTNGADGCISPNFSTGRCAIGFAPPGCWKGIFLNGIARKDENGTNIWTPTMKSGEYAEPYRFKPFGSRKVVDRTTGKLTDCTPELCPKGELIPARGHYADDDRASVLPASKLEGTLINRSPFYWSGGLGTLIRKSAPEVRKDLLWDFFVYTNSPATSVFDVANYGSWLDSWRYSQLVPGDNFLAGGWSQNAYQEHSSIMQWAFSKEINGAFNLRLPGTAEYTKDAVGGNTLKYFADELTLDELLVTLDQEWRKINNQRGVLEQLEVYRSSLGLDQQTEVEQCRLHRELMDERDPSICRKYDESNESTILIAVLVPVGILFIALLAFVAYERKRRKDTDLVWRIDASELQFEDPPKVLGKGTFGYVLKAEYRGTAVAVKRFMASSGGECELPKGASTKKADIEEGGNGTAATVPAVEGPNAKAIQSFSARVSAAAPAVAAITKDAVTPTKMGNTMSAMQSKQMVDMIKEEAKGSKSGGSSSKKSKAGNSSGWTSAFKTDKEYEKQKAEFVEEIKKLATLRHQCVITIMGAVMAKEDSMIVLEFMDHGSLYDVLHNETMVLDGEIILPILRDIAQGIRFLHAATPQIIHCDLKASNILVDGRFRAKVADFGLSTMDASKGGAAGTPYFLSPEILRGETGNTVESDAYAYGMVIFEMYARKDPYEGEKPLEVLVQVANKAVNKRPPIPACAPPKAASLMMECLVGDPRQRPTFEELDLQLKRLDTATMEPLAPADQNKQEQALDAYAKFPPQVAETLRAGRKVEPQSADSCTIFSSQICGFDELAASLDPVKVAGLLDRLYSKFDKLADAHDIYKVETISNAFMAITGLVKEQPDHAKRIAEFSIAALKAANETPIDEEDPSKGFVEITAGFSSGHVVANVVGTTHPRYCLFGDAVTTASRMEQSCLTNHIQCSEMSAILLDEQAPDLPVAPRGLMEIKGKGEMFTFFVNQEEDVGASGWD